MAEWHKSNHGVSFSTGLRYETPDACFGSSASDSALVFVRFANRPGRVFSPVHVQATLANRSEVRRHPLVPCLVREESFPRIVPQQVILVAALPQQLPGKN